MKYFIYTLTDPNTNEIRYVGQTVNIVQRMHNHMNQCTGGKSHVARWLRLLKAADQLPALQVIDITDTEHWRDRERYWIAYYQTLGCPLTNVSIGGKGTYGYKHSAEKRSQISKARMGMKFTDEHRQHLKDKKDQLYATKRGTELRNQYSRAYGVLSDTQVIEVWKLAITGAMSQKKIGALYGIPPSTVSEIKTGKRYKHVKRPPLPLFD